MKSIITSIIATAGLMVAGSAIATDMPAVAKKNNCTACHAVDKKVVGPAWKDVAAKTSDQAVMAASITKGSKGKYSAMPMPPQKISDADMKEITAFILALNTDTKTVAKAAKTDKAVKADKTDKDVRAW